MRILPLAREHVDDVARLHGAHLTGLVSLLGPRATRAFYAGCVGSALAIAFVALEGDAVRGFVMGSVDAGALRRDAFRRNRLGMLLGASIGILTRPTTLRWLLEHVRGTEPAGYDTSAAELIYLAVSTEARGSGLGGRLVEAFARALELRGVRAFELSVDAENEQAIRFYQRMGMRRVGQYREFGALHVRFRMERTDISTS